MHEEESSVTLEQFAKESAVAFDTLLAKAKSTDEFGYVFAILGIDSGIEDAGWQPIGETLALSQDFVALANTPLVNHTKVRLLLVTYCQILESSYMYHVIYNLLLCTEGAVPPKVFNFSDQIRGGNPPSVKSKIDQIRKLAKRVGIPGIGTIFDRIFDAAVRNAVSHADYILFRDELRLKHKGLEFRQVPITEVAKLVECTFHFFQLFFDRVEKHKHSYSDGHVISGRKTKEGQNLASITLKVHSEYGLYGFSTSDPLPLW